MNKVIKDRVRAALPEDAVGEESWAEAAVAAVYVMNRTPKAGHDETPWEMFTGKRPDVSGLVVWGSPAFAFKPHGQQRGMQPRASLGRMMGCTPSGRGYRILLHGGKEVMERREVAFDEAKTPLGGTGAHWGCNSGSR